jgi:hypothetical protein
MIFHLLSGDFTEEPPLLPHTNGPASIRTVVSGTAIAISHHKERRL